MQTYTEERFEAHLKQSEYLSHFPILKLSNSFFLDTQKQT